MKVDLIVVGKTDQAEVRSLVAAYLKRLNFYAKVTLTELPDLKNTRSLSAESQKRQEGEALLRQFGEGDYVVLLDEKGAQLRSVDFALWLQKRMNSGLRRLCFVIGGPYGFSPKVYERADGRLSLSAMTFSHQIVRALFAEQLYRAFTIIRNEPYPSRIVRYRFAEPALCPTGARDLFPTGQKSVPHYDYCRAADVRSSR